MEYVMRKIGHSLFHYCTKIKQLILSKYTSLLDKRRKVGIDNRKINYAKNRAMTLMCIYILYEMC